MKRHGNLYGKITTFENLLEAAKKAQKGKRTKPNVSAFNLRLEHNLFDIQTALMQKTWRPGQYTSFYIYDPKKRLISAAPYQDRVVHHALCNIIEPIFDRAFIFDSYANRKGKGTHRAADRFTRFCRANRYVLKCDIRKYFPSIDHEILFQLIKRKIKDPDALWLIKTIIDYSNTQEPVYEYFEGDDLFTPFERRKGIPIGNLTSQFFANIYLNGFDHFIKHELGCLYYIRYVDDFVILSNSKAHLHEVKQRISDYLVTLRLRLHRTKTRIFPVTQGTMFLGYRIFPNHRLLKRENISRFQKRIKELQSDYARGRISLGDVNQSITSWISHADHADTFRLRYRIISGVIFQRGRVEGTGASWRGLEQQSGERALFSSQQEQPRQQEQQCWGSPLQYSSVDKSP